MTIPVIALIWIATIVVALVAFRTAWNLTRYVWPSNQIVVGGIRQNGAASEEWSARFFERWRRYSTTRVPVSPQSGFTEDLNLTAYPVLKRASDNARIPDFNIKLGGVDVSGLTGLIACLAEGSCRKIEGNFNLQGRDLTLTLVLTRGTRTLETWRFKRSCLEDKSDREERTYELLEQGVFALMHREGGQMSERKDQLSPAAFAAYRKGRYHLEMYFKTREHTELKYAQSEFQRLTYEAPQYVDGLLQYGLTLSEDRMEQRAVDWFEQAQKLTEDKENKWQIHLMTAKSRLRMYEWASCMEAIRELEQVRDEIETYSEQSTNRDATIEILLAQVFAEIAHCYGHVIVFLRPKGNIEAEKDLNTLPGFKTLTVETAADTDLPNLVNRVFEAHSKNIEMAGASTLPEKDETSEATAARISEVKGYARFRRAQWLPPDRDNDFVAECDQALQDLKEAEAANPMSYALLQNIGMIHLSRRNDPQGEQLRTAEHYFQRAKELKPGDYYSYQQLAVCSLRKVDQASDLIKMTDEIQKGIESLDKSIELRPTSMTLKLLKAQLLLMKWLAATDQDSSSCQNELKSAFKSLTQDTSLQGQLKWRTEWVAIVWATCQLKTTCETKFDKAKKELIGAVEGLLALTEAEREKDWFAAQIWMAANSLRSALVGMDFDNRQELKRPLLASSIE